MINIYILTVKRPGNSPYLDRLIKSIRQDYKGIIHLVVGGTDRSYVGKYVNKDYKIKFIEDEEKGLKDNVKKAALGYYTCMMWDRTKSALILEDDALLDKGWYKKLKKLITFTADKKFILSLISPDEKSVPVPNIDIPSIQKFIYYSYLDYGAPGELPKATYITYCNTTGIYYPASMLQTRLPEYIYKFAVDGDAVHDIVLGQYMFRYNLPVHIAVPNLCLGVDTADSSLGSVKRRSHVDYSDWDYKKP